MEYALIGYWIGFFMFAIAVFHDKNTLAELTWKQIGILAVITAVWPVAIVVWLLDRD